MSRRHRQAAFSLFSFQDIVTSVTAILILIVLILSLELLDRTAATAAASPAVTRAGLVGIVTSLQELVLKLESQAPIEAGIAPLAMKTAAEIERELRVVGDQLTRATNEARAADEVARRATVRSQELAGKLREQEAAVGRISAKRRAATELDADARRVAVENERERQRLAKKRREVDGKPRTGTELVFNAPPNAEKQPWLVEVSADGVAAVRLGSNERRSLGAAGSVASGFATWVQSLRPDGDYALMLVRPSGIDDYERVREALQARQVDFGIDFIGEDQPVRDGSGGVPSRGGR